MSRSSSQHPLKLEEEENPLGRPPVLITTQMTGQLPRIHDWSEWVVDQESQKIWTYGGVPLGSEDVTANFYSCDMQTMNWTKHTVRGMAQFIRYPAKA